MGMTSKNYHDTTSYGKDKMSPHFLDWQNQPSVYKAYPSIEPIPLPPRPKIPKVNLQDLLSAAPAPHKDLRINPELLSSIFLLTYSITGRARHGGEDFYFRSVASAGALYPCELYVASEDVQGVDDGLYHFSIAHHGLHPLRKERVISLANGLIAPPMQPGPSLVFFITAIFFRSAWKYRERAYRYCLLDAGHLLENLALALKAWGLKFDISYDFKDKEVNELLGLDESREVTLVACRVWSSREGDSSTNLETKALPRMFKEASRGSAVEKHYPLILEIHEAGSLDGLEGSDCQGLDQSFPTGIKWQEIDPSSPWPTQMEIDHVVIRRRSKRNFIPQPLEKEPLLALLSSLLDDDKHYSNCMEIRFLLSSVEGHEPGLYTMDAQGNRYGLISKGRFIPTMASICLDQMWLANAALHFLFVSDLERLDQTIGPRGYRYVMLEAGRLGERIYLVATALGLGSCGIGAFYDVEAAQLLELSENERLLYLVASGPVKK